MTIGASIIGILIAGMIGGFLNALFTEQGLVLPTFQRDQRILRLGFLGNILIGAVAGLVSCALSGVFRLDLTLPELITAAANALVVAVAGARWLTNESEKKILTLAASKAMASDSNMEKSAKMMSSSPQDVLNLAQEGELRKAA